MRSPIKYYGGKSYMTKILLEEFPEEGSYDIYVEGFGGGASLLFAKEPGGIEVYNDLDSAVYSLFVCLAEPEAFKRLYDKMTRVFYSRQMHDRFLDKLNDDHTYRYARPEDIAFLYLYVNRSSFNGVGGFSVSKYLRRGMSKSTSDFLSMIDGLPEVHERLKPVIIEHMDILDLLDRYDDERTFMYLDPPYVQDTRKSSQKYRVDMDDFEHKKFVEELLKCKGKILLSGYDHPIYAPLEEAGWTKKQFVRPNSKDIETIWRNY